MSQTHFDQLQQLASESGVEKSLDFLEHHFRRDKSYFKLFEVLKMRCRHRMGLPLIYSQQPDDLSDSQQRDLEDGLLEACREIGTLFVKSGQIQEGWMYLQPVGDKKLNEKLIRSIPVDEENIDSIIEVAITQGAAPAYGYELLLDHYGTCNGITTFDTQGIRFDVDVQRQMSSRLLRHLHKELLENVRYAIKESGSEDSESATLDELMTKYPALTENGAHHIDTTHLASAMRIGRMLDDPADISLARQLAKYGTKLDKDFHYPGAPPFEDTYVDHGLYYSALLGEKIDEAIAHFQAKSESIKVEEYGPVANETLVELLSRVGRDDEALKVATERLMGNEETMGIAPSAFDLAKTPDQLGELMKVYKSRDDLLGFAVALLKSKTVQQ